MKTGFLNRFLFLLYAVFGGPVLFGQTNITRLEYFVDTDPGFGAGVAVNITPSTSINNQLVNLDISNLSNGLHNVYFRSRNTTGWSLSQRLLFLKQQTNASQVNKMEFYLDNVNDPGFGSATNIPITAGSTVSTAIPVNINGLTNGIHKLFVRSRDNSGAWSITNQWLFLKQQLPGEEITKLEYFLDNIADPGFGNATNIPITAGSTASAAIPVNIGALSNGIHQLYLRSRDNNGAWSITNKWLFVKQQLPNQEIMKLEYFLDNITDPGFGQATNVDITAASTINDLLIPVDISMLSSGLHQVYIRSKDNNGSWSLTNRWLFLKANVPGNIVKAEYFFNTDPGFGKGTNISITPGASINDILLNLSTNGLPLGLNNVYVRSQNANGSWAITNRWMFYNEPRNGAVTNIEYYYDTDPGFGNGIPVAINATNLLADYQVPVNVTGLSLGNHVIYLRTKSARGWSLTNKDTFNVTATSTTPFINVNSVTSKINCAWNSFRISFHATGTYNPGNKFTVQLSDKDGSFASPTVIGDTVTQKSSEVYCVLPSHLPDGNNYRIRVVSSNATVTGVSGIDAITINDRPELGSDKEGYIVCLGETFNLVPLYNTAGFTTATWNTPNPVAAPGGTHRLIVSNIKGCTDSAYVTVKQEASIWTGTISKNWHTAGNWSNGKVPNESTHVIVTGTAVNPCEISDMDGTAASVQVKASGSISLLNNRVLFIQANCNSLPTGQ